MRNAAPIPGDTNNHMDLTASGVGVFLATGYDSAGNVVAMNQKKVYWVSTNPPIATVKSSDGTVRAVKYGYATIYATYSQGNKSVTGSARACIVPRTPFYLNPRVIEKGVTVAPGRNLGAPPTIKVGDTAQMVMTAQLFADDTTTANIDTWGPCVHWTLNAGPQTPTLPPAEQINITRSGLVTVKCCTPMFYPSAYVGTMILTGLREWRPVGGVPTIRIAEDGHPRELVGWGTVRPSWLKAPEDLPQMHKPDWLSWPKR